MVLLRFDHYGCYSCDFKGYSFNRTGRYVYFDIQHLKFDFEYFDIQYFVQYFEYFDIDIEYFV